MNLIERTLRRSDYSITSPFGMRYHPIEKKNKMHNGVDIGTKLQNWDCYALEDGVVVNSGFDGSAGIFVWVEYKRLGYRVCLFHLLTCNVKKGQLVNESTILGKVGTTGSSTAIHLHLGVKMLPKLNYVNPMNIDYKEEIEIEKPNVPIKKRYLYLSKLVNSWRVYPLNKPCRVGYEVGKLAPKRYGGLKYEILEDLGNGCYVIYTSSFGKVKIFAGLGTLKSIREE